MLSQVRKTQAIAVTGGGQSHKPSVLEKRGKLGTQDWHKIYFLTELKQHQI